MAWDIRSTYYYLVCFATLLMVIFGTVQIVQRTLDLFLPPEYYRPGVEMLRDPSVAGQEPLTAEERERIAREEADQMRRIERRNAIRGLLGSIALVLIAAPVYLYHWRQIRTPRPH
jgi:hypothetical protein